MGAVQLRLQVISTRSTWPLSGNTMALLVYLQRCMGLVHVVLILIMDGSHTHLIDALQQAGGGYSPDLAPGSSIHLDDKAGDMARTAALCRWTHWHRSRERSCWVHTMVVLRTVPQSLSMPMHEMALTVCMTMQAATASAAPMQNRSESKVAAPV